MMSLFLAIHIHAAKRGDGLLPEFLGQASQWRDVPKAMSEKPAADVRELNVASQSGSQARKSVRRPVVL